VLLVVWLVLPVVDDPLMRVQAGYLGATAVLGTLLFGVTRRTPPSASHRRP
jgi:hypothetical protein